MMYVENILLKKRKAQNFRGNPVGKTLHFQYRDMSSILGRELRSCMPHGATKIIIIIMNK